MSGSIVLILFVIFLVVVGGASKYFRSARMKGELVVVLSGLLLLVWIGPILLGNFTNGRAAIGETTPWFIVTAIILGGLWVWIRKPFSRLTGDGAIPQPVSQTTPPRPAEQQTTASTQTIVQQHRQSVFLSYRRQDSAHVTGRMYDRLIEEFGSSSIHKDVDTVPMGVDFREYLDKLVGECDILIAVIGHQWLDAERDGKKRLQDSLDLVRIEIESALARDIPVIPVLVRGAVMPQEDDLPDALKPLAFRNGIQVRADPDFHKDMNRLISGLKDHFEQA